MDTVVEVLDREECLRLLATRTLGRVAVAEPGAAPHVVPVDYGLLRNSIVFRSAPGTKLRLLVTEPVSFEVDGIDDSGTTAWSVLVSGLAYEASDREMEFEEIDLRSSVEQQNSRWVRLMPVAVTGRRVPVP